MNHRTIQLATGRINGGRITIELVEPVGKPTFVRIAWPTEPATVVSPQQFGDVANEVARLFARGHVVLAGIKAHGRSDG